MDYVFSPADILLPTGDFKKWAVVACDQFTSEKNYWDGVEKIVGNAPSTLRITLPEIFLDDNLEKRIDSINSTMKSYLDSGVFAEHKNSYMYVERTQSDGTVRKGLVGMIKLSDYDYRMGSHALIRATEQTVVERIPPRVKIRRDAPLELPHVLLLIDDPDFTVIEPFAGKKLTPAYDFDLMQNGGHIKGFFVDGSAAESINSSLEALSKDTQDKLIFAVGDGNHSLATAKECSLINKSEKAEYALVEIVNIHDSSIAFEPIYRVLFDTEPMKVLSDMKAELGTYSGPDAQKFTCIYSGGSQTIFVKPASKLPVGTLQSWLDVYIKKNSIKIDYIHGEDTVRNLCKEDGRIGFIFNGMRKDELFAAVKADGSLPRKTFSMGHATDKRYYIEARKIK